MKLGRPLRGLGAAALAALASVPLAPSAASAAPAAPPAYTAVARAYPLSWAGSGGLPVVDLRVPYVSGMTNHLPVAEAKSALAQPDLQVAALSGETIKGLACTGFDEKTCVDPFYPEARSGHASVEPARTERVGSFEGKDGKFPGRILALTECGGDCGNQLVHSLAEAAGPAGGMGGYVSVGASTATHDLTIDDKGRVVALARSELRDVVIGPKGEIRFSSLTTTAQALGAGAENTKEGRADVRVADFIILDNPVELTRAGLRLANGAPSEQEAYDGAKALLEKLKERGITLELPDFAAQVNRTPDQAIVQAGGLRVTFDQSVQGPPGVSASAVSQVLELGSSTALVAAFDRERRIDVSFDGGEPFLEPEPVSPPPAVTPGPSSGPPKPVGSGPSGSRPTPSRPLPRGSIDVRTGPVTPPTDAVGAPEPAPGAPTEVLDPATLPRPGDPATNPDDLALEPDDVARALGLRGARSVSRAFGAFLGLGLILPLARLVIRRFG